MDSYRRAQPEEEGFGHGGQLRGVVLVDEEVPTPGAVDVREVGRLWLKSSIMDWEV
jgi:hypothetical protein